MKAATRSLRKQNRSECHKMATCPRRARSKRADKPVSRRAVTQFGTFIEGIRIAAYESGGPDSRRIVAEVRDAGRKFVAGLTA